MIELRMVGWQPGIQTVSLVQALREYSTGSLEKAKSLVEALLGGEVVVLQFTDQSRMLDFREIAERLGARFE